MALLFHLTILSSDKRIYDGEVQSLVAPGEIGYFGVLANHAPFITSLVPGYITMHDPSGNLISFDSASGGYFEVNNNKAILLLDKDVSIGIH